MNYLQRIDDFDTAEGVWRSMDEMVLGPHLFSPAWLEAQSWTVAIVEQKPYDDDLRTLCAAVQEMDEVAGFLAVNEDPTLMVSIRNSGLPVAYRLDLVEERVWEVYGKEDLWHYVWFPASRRCALLQASPYHLIGGPRSFVEKAVGGSLVTAWNEIQVVCDKDPYDGWVLNRTIREYQAFSGVASAHEGA